MQHVTIYRQEGRFAGWPPNHGIWSSGDEIIAGFALGYLKVDGGFHARDRDRPLAAMQARSLDGGQTWQVQETPCRAPSNRGPSANKHMHPDSRVGQALKGENVPAECPSGIDFAHPDLALMCARSGLRAGARSWFWLSYDRCRTWEGPFSLPMFGQTGVAAQTDYLVTGPNRCMFFLTAANSNGDEGRVFCAQTADGGKIFEFVSYIAPEPEGLVIMPANVRISDSRILAALRCRGGLGEFTTAQHWIDLYAPDDNRASPFLTMNRAVIAVCSSVSRRHRQSARCGQTSISAMAFPTVPKCTTRSRRGHHTP